MLYSNVCKTRTISSINSVYPKKSKCHCINCHGSKGIRQWPTNKLNTSPMMIHNIEGVFFSITPYPFLRCDKINTAFMDLKILCFVCCQTTSNKRNMYMSSRNILKVTITFSSDIICTLLLLKKRICTNIFSG